MSAPETYWYILCKTDTLRTLFGGDVMTFGGGGDELSASSISQRQTIKQMGYPLNKTTGLCRSGQIGTNDSIYLKVSSSLINALEPYLDPSEWASRTQTNPGIGSGNGETIGFTLSPTLFTAYILGDSIDYGTSIKDPSTQDIYPIVKDAMDTFHYSRLAHEAVDTNIRSTDFLVSASPTSNIDDRSFYGDRMIVHKLAVPSSSYANTVGSASQIDFIHRCDLKFNQLYRTLLSNDKTVFFVGFGTNDVAYDTSLTASQLFARESYWVGKFREHHPNSKIIIATDIRRTNDPTLNGRIHSLNQLRRANYLSIGANYVCDFEATHSDFNCLTGNITVGINGLYADNDAVHPSKLGHFYMKNALIPIFQDILGTVPLSLKRLILTNSIVKEHSSIGTVIGTIFNNQSGSTLSLTNSASGKFTLSGNNILVNQDLEFTDGAFYNITIRETLAGALNSPKDNVIRISIGDKAPIIDVAPQITYPAGTTLTLRNGDWVSNPSSYTYQWKIGSANIAGATSNTYTTISSDVGKTITCAITNISTSTVSTITGSIPTGTVFSTTNGTWFNVTGTYTYQWKRGGVDISGANSNTYTTTGSDTDTSITCSVTSTNSDGFNTAVSNTIAIN